MKQLEGLLREGMAKHGITGDTADRIVLSITSFALYGFPESHAASFALLAYASAYFKMHYPAAFYTALLNNQPMGFYHPATLVKDAQRRGVRFNPIDVQVSDWDCTVEGDGAVRLGLRYVRGLRAEVGKRIADTGQSLHRRSSPDESRAKACPKCGCDDPSMIEAVRPQARKPQAASCFCNVCSHEWTVASTSRSNASARSMIWCAASRCAATRSRCSPRSARSIRSATIAARRCGRSSARFVRPANCSTRLWHRGTRNLAPGQSPLDEMNISERLIADYTGTGLTVGPHPLTFRRHELAMRGVMPAIELPRAARGTPRPHRRHGDHAPASGHRERVRLPHARRRDRHLEHHHPPRSLRHRSPDRRRIVVPARRRHAAEPGRRDVDQGGADVEAGWHARTKRRSIHTISTNPYTLARCFGDRLRSPVRLGVAAACRSGAATHANRAVRRSVGAGDAGQLRPGRQPRSWSTSCTSPTSSRST